MSLSSSNRKYPPFPLLTYYSVVVCLRCLLHHILSLIAYTFRENREFVFIIIVQFKVSANIRIRFWLADRTRLFVLYTSHYHHRANYLKALNLQNACPIYFVECVSKIKHILSVIHYTICGAVCFQFTHFLVMIEIIYILCLIIIIKSEVWTITRCLGSGHETMVSALCLSTFLSSSSSSTSLSSSSSLYYYYHYALACWATICLGDSLFMFINKADMEMCE